MYFHSLPLAASPTDENMIRLFLFLAVGLTSVKCVNEKSRDKFEKSLRLCNGTTLETFEISRDDNDSSGLFGEWLTDSSTFRQFIGTTDNNYHVMWVECLGDTFILTKRDTIKHIDVKTFRLSELQRLDNFK